MYSSDEDIEVRFDRTELFTKKYKNNQKIRESSGTVRRYKISSTEFGSKFYISSIFTLYLYSEIFNSEENISN